MSTRLGGDYDSSSVCVWIILCGKKEAVSTRLGGDYDKKPRRLFALDSPGGREYPIRRGLRPYDVSGLARFCCIGGREYPIRRGLRRNSGYVCHPLISYGGREYPIRRGLRQIWMLPTSSPFPLFGDREYPIRRGLRPLLSSLPCLASFVFARRP